jgi:hypothetical protein
MEMSMTNGCSLLPIEHAGRLRHLVESLGVPAIDVRLPQGGLERGNGPSAREGARIQVCPEPIRP